MENLEDVKEFEETVGKYSALISKICYYFSNDSEEFKDLRQEVLVNIWRGWNKFRNDAKISTWIYRISFNSCISFQRKQKKHKDSVPLEQAFQLYDDTEKDYLEKYKKMHSLIARLNYQDRAIILMWLDEKTYEEISELMGLNRNTLAVRLKRIKEKLIKLSGE